MLIFIFVRPSHSQKFLLQIIHTLGRLSHLPTTQIVWPQFINIVLKGDSTSNTGASYQLEISEINTENPNNYININGAGTSGRYLGGFTNCSENNKLCFIGAAGGNLAGNPEIMLININGSVNITVSSLLNNIRKPLEFTGLLQVVMLDTHIELTLVPQFATIYLVDYDNSVIQRVFNTSETFNLSNSINSVSYSNNTRYINIGEFTLTFSL